MNEKTSNFGFSDRFYQSRDKLKLYFRDYSGPASGSRVPVLCLHGLTRNSGDFGHLADWLSLERRVIATDFRGRGRSAFDPDWRNYCPKRYADDIWELLDILSVSRVLVIGTSLGGWLAMLMAHERPGVVAAAVINDIGPDVDPSGLSRIQLGAGRLGPAQSFAEAVEKTRGAYEQSFPDWTNEQWHHYANITYREGTAGAYELNSDPMIGHASRYGVSGLHIEPWILFSALNDIPTLLLRGENSDLLALETVSKMQNQKPDLRCATVRNRGHAPFLDEPEAVNEIRKFVTQN